MGRGGDERRQPLTNLGTSRLCRRLCGLVRQRRLLVKTTDYFAHQHERCDAWNDPAIGITWPPGLQPKLSAKDKTAKPLAGAELF